MLYDLNIDTDAALKIVGAFIALLVLVGLAFKTGIMHDAGTGFRSLRGLPPKEYRFHTEEAPPWVREILCPRCGWQPVVENWAFPPPVGRLCGCCSLTGCTAHSHNGHIMNSSDRVYTYR